MTPENKNINGAGLEHFSSIIKEYVNDRITPDEIYIGTTEPTGDEKLWFNPESGPEEQIPTKQYVDTQVATKSTVSASATGSSTDEINYITINDHVYKIAGSGGDSDIYVYGVDDSLWVGIQDGSTQINQEIADLFNFLMNHEDEKVIIEYLAFSEEDTPPSYFSSNCGQYQIYGWNISKCQWASDNSAIRANLYHYNLNDNTVRNLQVQKSGFSPFTGSETGYLLRTTKNVWNDLVNDVYFMKRTGDGGSFTVGEIVSTGSGASSVKRCKRDLFSSPTKNDSNYYQWLEQNFEFVQPFLEGMYTVIPHDLGNYIMNLKRQSTYWGSTSTQTFWVENPIPETPPSSDGTYTLKCQVTNGTRTYSWVKEV